MAEGFRFFTHPPERLEMPLRLGDGTRAVIRDIGPSGLYFEVEGDHTITGPLVFELQLAGGRVKFSATGEIERLERVGNRTGVTIRFLHPRLQAID